MDYLHFIKASKNAFYQLKISMSCCDLCGGQCQSQTFLCDYCIADLPKFHFDQIKGNLIHWPAIDKILPQRQFEHLIALSPYTWPFDRWVTQLKYQRRFELTQLLAQLLHNQYQQLLTKQYLEKPPLLLSVPIHIDKWQQRGFNQAHMLAKAFSTLSKIPYEVNLLIRNTNHSQVGKTGALRRKSLKGAFSINQKLLEKLTDEVMLIDDVVTTGATCNEICKLLKQHGVKKITVLSICLSLPIH